MTSLGTECSLLASPRRLHIQYLYQTGGNTGLALFLTDKNRMKWPAHCGQAATHSVKTRDSLSPCAAWKTRCASRYITHLFSWKVDLQQSQKPKQTVDDTCHTFKDVVRVLKRIFKQRSSTLIINIGFVYLYQYYCLLFVVISQRSHLRLEAW